MQRVLLTGATGFLGRHCLPRLVEGGLAVDAVCGQRAAEERSGVRWHRTDLLDPEAVARLIETCRPTRLLHLAWHTRPTDLYTSPLNLAWAEASLGLVRAATAAGLERAVFAGSSAEYDWSHSTLSEHGTPLAPRSVYGRAKQGLSVLVDGWSRATGLSSAWARIFFLYGPGERPPRLVPSVVTSLLAGREARCTHGGQIRDYLYVEDAAEALVELVASGIEGPINVASGEPLELRRIVEEAARQLDARELLRLGALDAPADDPPRLVADVGRLAGELGWTARTGLSEGLARTIEWWRQGGDGEAGS